MKDGIYRDPKQRDVLVGYWQIDPRVAMEPDDLEAFIAQCLVEWDMEARKHGTFEFVYASVQDTAKYVPSSDDELELKETWSTLRIQARISHFN